MEEDIHKNHRERMRRRFIEHGLNNFSDHEVLELLLYYTRPRGDVNPLAHRLINTFGSLPAVLDASFSDLCAVEGVGEKTAVLLQMIPPLLQRYQVEKVDEKEYSSPPAVGEYLVNYFLDKKQEVLLLMLLDNGCRLIRTCEIGIGSPSSVHPNYRKIAQCSLQYNAASVILAHNHPGGNLEPSVGDLNVTKRTHEFMENMGVPLVDHFIVADKKWVSMSRERYYKF